MGSDDVRVEVSAKRLRAYLGGHLVVDTLEPRLVWEVPYYPTYYVRRSDVVAEFEATGGTHESRRRGTATLWTVRVNGHEATEAAATYDESAVADLHGLVRFDWSSMDAWFEENEQVYVHARSPYTRVDILPSSRHVTVRLGDEVVADSTHAFVLHETGLPPRWYLPKIDARLELLTPTDTVTHCPYKGDAEYWMLHVDGRTVDDAVWSYPRPMAESVRIASLLCFDTSKLDVEVDGVKQD